MRLVVTGYQIDSCHINTPKGCWYNSMQVSMTFSGGKFLWVAFRVILLALLFPITTSL
jgi:hypothetical protein